VFESNDRLVLTPQGVRTRSSGSGPDKAAFAADLTYNDVNGIAE